jgi:hypothetical protein
MASLNFEVYQTQTEKEEAHYVPPVKKEEAGNKERCAAQQILQSK